MSMKRKLLGGTALLIAAFSLNEVSAETPLCTIPPTCESLGYDRTAGECSDAVKSLRCPLDKDKVFCLTAAEVEEIVGGNAFKKVAEIGDIVYVDGISAEPIPGRIPVGIVYDVSGKMVSVAEYGKTDNCSSHTADGTTGWALASMEDMGSIKANVEKINATIDKIGNNTPKLTLKGNVLDHVACYLASNGQACMIKSKALTSSDSYGCEYCQSGPSNATRSRCVRKFGPNGANDVASTPAPTVTTYAVGDAYKDSEGNIIGTVVEVNANRTSGIIAYAEGSGTANEASINCSKKITDGKSWTLASGKHACQLLKTIGNATGETGITCAVHTVDGQGACTNSTWKKKTEYYYQNTCGINDSLIYVCTTTF